MKIGAATEPEFPFHHGRLALSFAGTLGDRGSVATERIGTPALLGKWLHAAHLLAKPATPSLAQYRRALLLREAIARVVQALLAGHKPLKGDITLINEVAHRWAARPSLDPRTLNLVSSARDPIEGSVGRIAVDAIEMLSTAEERSRLRACALESCAAVFLTPAGRRERRWCAMARCGNRAKVTSFRARATS